VTNVDASEVQALAFDLRGAPARSRRKASTVVRRTAFAIERDAKILSPVDTGNLRNGIGTDATPGALSATVGPTAGYGLYVEEGTSRMGPQPYMRPAADRNAPGFATAMGRVAEDSVLGDGR